MTTELPEVDGRTENDALLGRTHRGAGWVVAGGALASAGWYWLDRIEVCGDSAVVFPAFALGLAAIIASSVGMSIARRVTDTFPTQERPITADSLPRLLSAGEPIDGTDAVVARLRRWTSFATGAGLLVIGASVVLILLALTGVASCGGPD